MKYQVIEWTIQDLLKNQDNIHYPVFQREDVWSIKDKTLLIDSIFVGIDIPKLYLYRVEEDDQNEINWDCVDGHQRIEAISGYLNGMFQYNGKDFSELSISDKNIILGYKLTICEIFEITEEEIRELFLRLQLGVPLNSGEKLHAIISKLGDFIRNKMENSTFIQKVSIPSRRYAKEALCAQILNNSHYIRKSNKFRSSKYEDLYLLYKKNREFDENSETAKKIIQVLKELDEIFGEDASLLRSRASAVSIYLLVEEMIFLEEPLNKKLLHDFYVHFLEDLGKENKKGALEFKERNVFLMRYQMSIIQGADARTAIHDRHQALKKAFDYYKLNQEIIFETINI